MRSSELNAHMYDSAPIMSLCWVYTASQLPIEHVSNRLHIKLSWCDEFRISLVGDGSYCARGPGGENPN